ncbi:MAG: hypothetical protein WEA56_17180 [Balneolaceae bacterium]
MIGYSEVIQTMAAMIIFSMILMNANRMIHRNTVMQVEGELEQEVIALGQEIIEEAHTKSFDEVTVGATAPPADIPGDFVASTSLGTDGETARQYYDDFDDYNGHTETAQTAHGDFEISVEVYYVDEDDYEQTSSKTTFKKIEVTITSQFLRNNAGDLREYRLEFIRNYYAD